MIASSEIKSFVIIVKSLACIAFVKDHLSYSITHTAYIKLKVTCISKLYNQPWGLYENNVARRGQRKHVCKLHDRCCQSQISQMLPPAKLDRGHHLLNFSQRRLLRWWRHCSLKDPRVDCKILRYGCLYVVRVMVYEKRPLFIVT